MTFPDRRFTRAILVSSFTIWLGIRGTLVFLGMLPRGAGPTAGLSLGAVVLLIALTTGLTLFDLRRSGQELFLADLAVPFGTLVLLAAGPPLVLELLVDVLVL
ncbi:MAG: hypothetical protein GTO22_00705 [Gemmatimonadales bacterium]|nr:hypothetical protein [Gemmatimonadales bacterium]